MSNEPVAWIRQGKYGKPTIVQNPLYQFSYQSESVKQPDIPLYTHPVNVTYELTMEKCRQQQAEIEALKAKDLKKSMAIRSLNTQLKKALQYETFNR